MVKIMPALTESEESKKGGVTRLTSDLVAPFTEEVPNRINAVAEVVKEHRARPGDGEPGPSKAPAKSDDRDQVDQDQQAMNVMLG